MKRAAFIAAALMLSACSESASSSQRDISSAADTSSASSVISADTVPAAEDKTDEAITEPTVNMPPQDPSILSDEYFIAASGKEIYDLLEGRFPVYSGTDVRFCPSGEAFFEKLKTQLKNAQHTVDMEYFIIDTGEMLDEILSVLEDRISAGVKVRVLYDGLVAETASIDKLSAAGADCRPYTAPSKGSINNRDHRKFTIIDGSIAFTGGANIGDNYINRTSPYGHWQDCAVMLTGSAVQSCSVLFEQQWGGSDLPDAPDPVPDAEGWVMPVGDSPFDDFPVTYALISDMLARAEDHVYITAPYFTIPDDLDLLIRQTAERGVDVVIIVPGITDSESSDILARSRYKDLVRSGVRLYRYDSGFIHAKIYSSDGSRALIGSMNLNSRSFAHDFECGAYLFDVPAISDIDSAFADILDRCTLLTEDMINDPTDFEKFKSRFMENLAPFF